MTLLWQFLSRVNIHFGGHRCRVLFPFKEGFHARVSDIKKHEKRIKEANKCNLCEYTSSNAGFIRKHMKKKKMLPVQLYIVVYQETRKYSQDQRDKQVQFL